MKKLLIFLSLIISINVFGQKPDLDKKTDSYKESLYLNIEFLKSVQTNYETLYVREAYYLNDLSGKFKGIEIIMLDNTEIHEMTSKGKILPLTVINPLKFESGEMIIFVVNFSVSRKRKKYRMVNNDRTKVRVFYDCEKEVVDYEVLN